MVLLVVGFYYANISRCTVLRMSNTAVAFFNILLDLTHTHTHTHTHIVHASNPWG